MAATYAFEPARGVGNKRERDCLFFNQRIRISPGCPGFSHRWRLRHERCLGLSHNSVSGVPARREPVMSTRKYRLNRRAALDFLGGTAAAGLVAAPGARVSAQTLSEIGFTRVRHFKLAEPESDPA
jgi:hypothetical protein